MMTNEEVVEFVRNAIADGVLPDMVSSVAVCSIRVICAVNRFVSD